MTTQGTQANSAPPAGFWKLRHAVIGLGVLMLMVILMARGCGDDEPEKQGKPEGADMPRQGVVVQIPASQWPPQQAPVQTPAPQQPGYGYMPQQQPGYGYAQQQQPGYGYTQQQQPGYGYTQQQQPGYGYTQQQPGYGYTQQQPAADGSNPWSVQTQPAYGYGQPGNQQWGQQQPQRPQYTQLPPGGSRYRPLESEETHSAPPRPAQQPVQRYYPAAPYDQPGGSSFAAPAYPYAGTYPGYYGGAGVYGVPGAGAGYGYLPGYPGSVPALGWPGVW
jgi:hypothetical protein